jgi:hypothetical protein
VIFGARKAVLSYQYKSNYIFAHTDTPPPHSIPGQGVAATVTVITNMASHRYRTFQKHRVTIENFKS